MRRVSRIVFNTATVLSLFLLATTLVLWVIGFTLAGDAYEANFRIVWIGRSPGRWDVTWRHAGLGGFLWWTVHDWQLTLIALGVISLRLQVAWRESRPGRFGLCPACGYDLRATPQGGRCPECGQVPPSR